MTLLIYIIIAINHVMVCAHPIAGGFALLLLCGFLFSGTLMIRTASMVKNVSGHKVKITAFTIKRFHALSTWLEQFPPRSVGLMLKWLRIDYLFMLFLYPLLGLLVWVITETASPTHTATLCQFVFETMDWRLIMLLNVGILAAMDVLENWFAIWTLQDWEKPNVKVSAFWMRQFSLGKWIASLALFIIVSAYFIMPLVRG